jgi:RNA polymerase sigma-70 factor, ECF subfamily
MSTMAATTDTTPALDRELESYRRELTGYCYRMLGSGFEAEDAVQETFVRAWRSFDRFEGRSSLRSWLYKIATNVCLDMLQGPQRRARPMDMGPSGTAESTLGAPLTESAWVLPIADARTLPEDGDPAELAAQRETLRLAFIAALQHLPGRDPACRAGGLLVQRRARRDRDRRPRPREHEEVSRRRALGTGGDRCRRPGKR